MTALDAAIEYAARGWAPVPVPFRKKRPILKGWQTLRVTAETAPSYFNGQPANVGVILGKASGGLADVDLDCPEAIEVAPYLLPPTRAIFGRKSARGAHRLYRVAAASDQAVVAFDDPEPPDDDRKRILELRRGGARGAQTVFPGSTHEDGEPIDWDEAGDPAEADAGDLLRRVRLVAAAALVARCWPRGEGSGRHDAALTLGGFLARAGFTEPAAKLFAEAVARAAGDPEWRDRVKAAEVPAGATTIRSLPALFGLMGERRAIAVADWLDYRERRDEPPPQQAGGNFGPIEPTEDGVARAFTARYADDLRFDHDAGRWYQWSGDHWRHEATGLALDFCRELAHAASAGPKPPASVRKANFAAGVERFARCDRAHAVQQEIWDRDPWLLACPGVTVDLRTGLARAPRPEDLITRLAGAAPAERADCPRWLAFLAEATGGDADMIRFLQQWTGYCLTGDTREHALLFVWGGGGNGKGVFLRTRRRRYGRLRHDGRDGDLHRVALQPSPDRPRRPAGRPARHRNGDGAGAGLG